MNIEEMRGEPYLRMVPRPSNVAATAIWYIAGIRGAILRGVILGW